MSGDLLKNILGDNSSECYICGDNEGLNTCKACKLTICEDCMSNEDLCENCMYELETTGGFDTYTGYEFEQEMYYKYVKQL